MCVHVRELDHAVCPVRVLHLLEPEVVEFLPELVDSLVVRAPLGCVRWLANPNLLPDMFLSVWYLSKRIPPVLIVFRQLFQRDFLLTRVATS